MSVELRHRAKFRQNRSNRDFFQDGGHPPSWICNACVGTTHEGHLMVFIAVQKFGWNRCSSFDNIHVFRFRLFMPPKWRFGGFDLMNGELYEKTKNVV